MAAKKATAKGQKRPMAAKKRPQRPAASSPQRRAWFGVERDPHTGLWHWCAWLTAEPATEACPGPDAYGQAGDEHGAAEAAKEALQAVGGADVTAVRVDGSNVATYFNFEGRRQRDVRVVALRLARELRRRADIAIDWLTDTEADPGAHERTADAVRRALGAMLAPSPVETRVPIDEGIWVADCIRAHSPGKRPRIPPSGGHLPPGYFAGGTPSIEQFQEAQRRFPGLLSPATPEQYERACARAAIADIALVVPDAALKLNESTILDAMRASRNRGGRGGKALSWDDALGRVLKELSIYRTPEAQKKAEDRARRRNW